MNGKINLPKISIITPSYNQGKFLEQTIRSIIDQNYPNLEFIIIDGGSTDNTIEIIKRYEKNISYWVSEPDHGQTNGINKGFRIATGDLVAWMNSDDIYYDNTFKTIASCYLETKGRYDVYFGNKKNISENGQVLHEFFYSPFFKYTLFYDDMNISNQSAFWKKTVFEKIGFLDEGLGFIMDYEFFVRMARNSMKFYYVDEFLGALRHHPEAKTSLEAWQKRKQKEIQNINEKYGIKKKLVFKLISKLYRIFNLIKRGKFKYVATGIVRKI